MTSRTGSQAGNTQGLRSGRTLLSPDEWDSVARSLHLSSRETEIVRAMFDDLTELAIAEELGISPHTVHSHVERLHRKLAVHSRCALIVRIFAEHVALHASRAPDHA